MEIRDRRQTIIRQSSAVYWMGLIAALIYFMRHADSFTAGLLGVVKAIVWPALLVYKLLDYFKM
jgi:hypothetical protein